MSKRKRERSGRSRNFTDVIGLGLSETAVERQAAVESRRITTRLTGYLKQHWVAGGVIVFVLLLGLGVMAKNGWLPRTDSLSGKKTGWFGNELATNASSSWNPLAPPLPSATPQLSKEYIYAGSRLLAVEDANANAAPPADLAVWRPSTGWWYVLGGQGSAPTYYQWGASGDTAVPGDFDGDGKTDFSVFRPSTGVWWIATSSNNSYTTYQFGVGTDVAAPADYDGDGKTDAAVYRPSSGTWYVLQSSNGQTVYQQFGLSTDTPAPADYDGDGRADIAVWRSSNHTFYSINSSNAQSSGAAFGSSGDTPVCADYDGDGRADYAVRSGVNWIILNSSNNQTQTIGWQNAGDKAVQNDYDGDGKVDIATWRPTDTPAGTVGHWYIRKSGSSGALREESWGMSGDIPVPAYYRR